MHFKTTTILDAAEKQCVMFLYRSVRSVHFARVLAGFVYSSIRRRSRLPGRTVKCMWRVFTPSNQSQCLKKIGIRKGEIAAGFEKCPKLLTFPGSKNANTVDNFCNRFETTADICGWTASQRALQ